MSLGMYVFQQQHDEHASDASSASLNLPGRNQVMDLREDSTEEMVETFLTRKSSYFARAEDMSVVGGREQTIQSSSHGGTHLSSRTVQYRG